MKDVTKNIFKIFTRYLVLLFASFSGLWIFYFIFTPLTVHPVYFLLGLFFDVALLSSRVILLISQNIPIEIVNACVAGSAYYLLLILNLTTPGIKVKTRTKMILFSFLSLLIVNVLRIFLLTLLVVSDSVFFDITHILFWYVLSTAFVVIIWFAEVKIFKIKEIPLYSDIKYLRSQSNKKPSKKSNKKPKKKRR